MRLMKEQINDIYASLCNKTECTGCSACMNICTKDAIDMKYDREGFLFPVINKDKCIKCGQCLSVCPIYEEKEDNQWNYSRIVSAYALNEDVLEQGSSGGVFPTLAQSVINDGGIVFGAVFDSKHKEIRHVSSEDVDILKIFRSKYVQSRIGMQFRQVKKQLKQGRKVLFSGTPCQIQGLQLYLKKDFENLITVDFICHGVPSPLIFKHRLERFEQKQKSEIIDCTFREKDNGWRKQNIKLYYKNGNVTKIPSKYGIFYNLFANNYILRKSCYNCKFCQIHKSDITLADFWDSNINKEGISKIFINTSKGKEILEKNIEKFYTKDEYVDNLNKYIHHYSFANREWFYKNYFKVKQKSIFFEYCRLRCLKNRLLNKPLMIVKIRLREK